MNRTILSIPNMFTMCLKTVRCHRVWEEGGRCRNFWWHFNILQPNLTNFLSNKTTLFYRHDGDKQPVRHQWDPSSVDWRLIPAERPGRCWPSLLCVLPSDTADAAAASSCHGGSAAATASLSCGPAQTNHTLWVHVVSNSPELLF